MRALLFCLTLYLTSSPLGAEDAPLGLQAPQAVSDSGFLAYLLPRFSLKTGIRVRPAADGTLVLADAPPGTPIFRSGGVVYHLRHAGQAGAARFEEWLTSDIGRRTIENFAGPVTFSAVTDSADAQTDPAFEGDTQAGAHLSLALCGRCHVIGPQNAGKDIGSTPSFAVLRALGDWEVRFQQFYVLRPHGAFTQITGVTDPFDPEHPPPIVPIEMTQEHLDAILAYVAASPAADLGDPLQTQ